MTDAPPDRDTALAPNTWDEVSLLDLLAPIVRRWKWIAALTLIGAIVAAGLSFLVKPVFTAETTFVAETSSGMSMASGLSTIAGQLGLAGAANTGTLTPDFLVSVLTSREVMGAVLLEEFPKPDTDGSAPLIDILGVPDGAPNRRIALGMRALNALVTPEIDRRTSIVSLEVRQPHPLLAAAVANELVERLNRFNLEQRQSQSRRQRIFTEGRLSEARRELREAENAYRNFLSSNRSFASPTLQFQESRLQLDVTLKQELFVSLATSYEEASISEVRDTPVLTVIDSAIAPFRRSAPNRKQYVIAGAALAALAAVTAVILADLWRPGAWRDRRDLRRLEAAWQGTRESP